MFWTWVGFLDLEDYLDLGLCSGPGVMLLTWIGFLDLGLCSGPGVFGGCFPVRENRSYFVSILLPHFLCFIFSHLATWQ